MKIDGPGSGMAMRRLPQAPVDTAIAANDRNARRAAPPGEEP